MEPVETPSRWNRVVRELLPLLVLFAASGKATFDEWKLRDLTRTDEAAYLACALHAADPWGWMGLETGPLYVMWYRLLGGLPVSVPYLSFASHSALMAILACLFYALARRLGVGRWVATAAAALLLLNTRIAMIEPFPVHLATAGLAAGALIGTYRRSLLGACGPVGLGILAGCYARPEFGTLLVVFLAAYVVAGIAAWWRRAECRRDFLPWAVPLALAVVAGWSWMGIPLPDGPRGWIAFGQHYARNVAESGERGSFNWVSEWRAVTQEDFGDATTVGQAARANPKALARHVGQNLRNLPAVVVHLCVADLKLAPTPRRVFTPLVFVGLGLGFVGLLRRIRAGRLRGPEGQSLRVMLLALACIAVVTGPSALVIYPREHYLLLPLFFLLVLAVSGLPSPRWPAAWLGDPAPWKRRGFALAVVLLIVGGTPTALHQWTLLRPLMTKAPTAYARTANVELRETMGLLNLLPRQRGLVVMDYGDLGGVRTMWMACPTAVVSHERKAEGFRDFVSKHHLDVIVLDPLLLTDKRFKEDPEFMALWNETDTGPFAVLSSGRSRIAVRRELVPPT